jgi:tetratricopeptide (TPR) repeat protein
VSHDDVVKGLDEIGRRYRDSGWLVANTEYLYQVVRTGLYSKSPVHDDAIWALFTISRVMLTSSNFRQWTLLLCDALAIILSGSRDNEVLMQIYNLLGQGYMLNRDVDTARQMYDTVFERAGESATPEQADGIMLLAYIGMIKTETYDYTHRFGPEIVGEALAAARRLDDRMLTAWLYQALGGAHGHRGESQQALGYGMTALGYWHRKQNPYEIAKTAVMLAGSYRRVNLIEQAQRVLKLGHLYIERTDNSQYKALIAYEQGVLDYLQQRYGESETWLRRAYEGFRLLDWAHHMAMTYQMIGMVLAERGDYEQARHHLARAMEGWRRLGHKYEQANTLYELGRVAKLRGKRDRARTLFGQSFAICRKLPPMPARDELEKLILAALDDAKPATADTL